MLFDLDGTLVDTMQSAPGVYVETIAALTGIHLTVNDIVDAWHIGPTPIVLEHFTGQPTSTEALDLFYQTFAIAAERTRPFPGVVSLLDSLATAGYRLGIVTSATARTAQLSLSGAGLTNRFVVVIAGDEVVAPKPAPDGILQACRQLQCDPNKTAYVGDAPIDIATAQAAGALPIHATWGLRNINVERSPHHATAASPESVLDHIR